MVSYFGSNPTMFKRAEPLSSSAWPLNGIIRPTRCPWIIGPDNVPSDDERHGLDSFPDRHDIPVATNLNRNDFNWSRDWSRSDERSNLAEFKVAIRVGFG